MLGFLKNDILKILDATQDERDKLHNHKIYFWDFRKNSNLDFFYAYHSSLLYLNSLFYLPYFKYNLFNSANLIIYISAIFLLGYAMIQQMSLLQ